VRHHYGFTRIPANPVRTVGESVDIENYRIVDIVLRHLFIRHEIRISLSCILGLERVVYEREIEKLTIKLPLPQKRQETKRGISAQSVFITLR